MWIPPARAMHRTSTFSFVNLEVRKAGVQTLKWRELGLRHYRRCVGLVIACGRKDRKSKSRSNHWFHAMLRQTQTTLALMMRVFGLLREREVCTHLLQYKYKRDCITSRFIGCRYSARLTQKDRKRAMNTMNHIYTPESS